MNPDSILNQIAFEIGQLQHDNAVLKETNIILNKAAAAREDETAAQLRDLLADLKHRDSEIDRLAHVSARVNDLNARVVYERDEALAAFDLIVKERNKIRDTVNENTVEIGRLQREWDVAHAANDLLVRQHLGDLEKIAELDTDKKNLLESIDHWREFANNQGREIEKLQSQVQRLESCTCKLNAQQCQTGLGYGNYDWGKFKGPGKFKSPGK